MAGTPGPGGEPDGGRAPIWARPHGRRASTLSREAIVDAALEIADTEGIDAVSIRRVATALAARAMSLYTYIGSKDDLLDLMADRITGEVLIEDPLPGDWREAITLIARRERERAHRHPWVVDMVNHRSHPAIGPNALRHVDQSVAAVAGLGLGPQDAFRVVAAIDDYVIGSITREARERRVTQGSGVGVTERLAELRPYLEHALAGEELAHVGPVLRGEVDLAEDGFERGLSWLLDGIERAYT